MQWLLFGVICCQDATRTSTQHDVLCARLNGTQQRLLLPQTAPDIAQFLNIGLFIIHIAVPYNRAHTTRQHPSCPSRRLSACASVSSARVSNRRLAHQSPNQRRFIVPTTDDHYPRPCQCRGALVLHAAHTEARVPCDHQRLFRHTLV